MRTNNFGHRGLNAILNDADIQDELVLSLATIIVSYKIPVTSVSRQLGVSRATVYKWLGGKSVPTGRNRDSVAFYVKEYEPN